MKLKMLALVFVASQAIASEDYNFLSGTDVHDALSQDSMIVQGYVLGVVDALKHQPEGCFTLPYQADADRLIFQAYLEYWREQMPPASSVDAIVEMMWTRFPCDATIELDKG